MNFKLILEALGLGQFNSFSPSDGWKWHRFGSTLGQVMACCLMARSHHLSHYWRIITEAFTCEQFHSRCSSNILYAVFENYTFKIIASSPMGQWVNPIHHKVVDPVAVPMQTSDLFTSGSPAIVNSSGSLVDVVWYVSRTILGNTDQGSWNAVGCSAWNWHICSQFPHVSYISTWLNYHPIVFSSKQNIIHVEVNNL